MEIFGQLVLATVFWALGGFGKASFPRKSAGMRTFRLGKSRRGLFYPYIHIGRGKIFDTAFTISPWSFPNSFWEVGFIGAGLIIFHGSQLRGLTTAAGLWVAAAIGVATAGSGSIPLAISPLFWLFWFSWFFGSLRKRITKKFTEPRSKKNDAQKN